MRLESKKYLFDIQRASALLAGFIRGKSFQDYAGDPMLRAAVEREFEIIGEALNQLAKVDAPIAARVSEHRRIIAFRNLLIHGYADVDDQLVWSVAEGKLPILMSEVGTLLQEG